MGNPHQPIMQTGWVDNTSEAVTHIYRMQDKRDPFRYMDFDPRTWNFIVVPILPDEAVVGYTNADQPAVSLRDIENLSGGCYRPCTCHPDDNPPRPCPQKYAIADCIAASKDLK